MENLNIIIANNLTNLRKAAKLTQLEFGEKFNYSDKTVSKWEIGTVVPSVEVLKDIAAYYGVTVDYILTEHDDEEFKNAVGKKNKVTDRFIFIGLVTTVIWSIAAVVYAAGNISHSFEHGWLAFIWAIPASAIIDSYFMHRLFKNSLWSLIMLSVAVWSLLAASFLQSIMQTPENNYWFLFVVGLPVQALLLLLILKKEHRLTA